VRRNPELYAEPPLALVERVDRRETIAVEAVAAESGTQRRLVPTWAYGWSFEYV
tara:strand:+ start:228 stop:389 length:162 start_codon:yes stop_codon:yes gene_type:complete